MTYLPRVALATLLAASILSISAHAEDQFAVAPPKVKTKPAKAAGTTAANHERRPGELEGWDKDAKVVAAPKARRLPPGALAEKPAAPDGGIPLPESKTIDPGAPVAFDQNGRPSGMFKF